jgi:hypothetical protein
MILQTVKKYNYMLDYPDANKYSIIKYGYQCDKGWYLLIDKLIDIIYHLDIRKEVRIYQIKEKFGTFRFYYNIQDISNKHILEVVKTYTKLINNTCEICGESGTIKSLSNTYLKTLCDTCNMENNNG